MAVVDAAQLKRRDAIVAWVRGAEGFNVRFPDWLLGHWDTWLQFEAAADKTWDAGLREYSAYVIVNVLRWRNDLRGTKFSLSNTMIPDLTRLYNAVRRRNLFTTSTRFGKEIT